MFNLSSPAAILQKTRNARMHEERCAKSIEHGAANAGEQEEEKKCYTLTHGMPCVYMSYTPNPAPGRKTHPHTRLKTQDSRLKTRDSRKTQDMKRRVLGSRVLGRRDTAREPRRDTACRVSTLVFLIGIQILSSILCLQEARTQEVIDHEISDLEQRLKGIETELASIDEELRSLNEKFNTVTNEKNKLTQELIEEKAKSKGFLNRITGIFGYRSYRKRKKQERLMTELQSLADKIREHQKRREPLVNEFVALADELIDKSSSRITYLMEVVREANLDDDVATRDKAWEQLSALWQLAERTRETRSKYAPIPLPSEQMITFPQVLSNDPEDLRLGAAILKDLADAARDDAAELERKIEGLERRKRMLERVMEVAKEKQRRDEEREAADIEATILPWGTDMAAERKINEIKEEIAKLSDKKQKYEDNAESFENQSIRLEQRASQIDAELKGKSEDD